MKSASSRTTASVISLIASCERHEPHVAFAVGVVNGPVAGGQDLLSAGRLSSPRPAAALASASARMAARRASCAPSLAGGRQHYADRLVDRRDVDRGANG